MVASLALQSPEPQVTRQHHPASFEVLDAVGRMIDELGHARARALFPRPGTRRQSARSFFDSARSVAAFMSRLDMAGWSEVAVLRARLLLRRLRTMIQDVRSATETAPWRVATSSALTV